MTKWLPVAGYEGLYEVSSSGQVRRLPSIISGRNNMGPMTRRWPGKILKQNQQKLGYLMVQLCKDGAVKGKLVHRLVCVAFNGLCPPGLQCAHLDGTRGNNVPNNLKWVTAKENQAHSLLHGTSNRGDAAHQAILKLSDIPIICRRRKGGETYSSIAKDYGVHLSTIQYAVSGKNWPDARRSV